MKQKLTYMLIGCLFTLAGFVISTLTNTPTHVQAQDEKVIDEVVCKKLKIVNDLGKTVAELDLSGELGGSLKIYNKVGGLAAKLDASVFGGNLELQNPVGENSMELNLFHGLKIKNDQGKTTVDLGNNLLTECGYLKVYNKDGRLAMKLESDRFGGAELAIYSGIGKGGVYFHDSGVYIDNKDAKTVAALKTDGLSIYNEDGMKIEKDGEGLVLKNELVTIGAVRGRPNDGLINIYNHKGKWRSFTAD